MIGRRVLAHGAKVAVVGLFAPDQRGPVLSAGADNTLVVIDPAQGKVVARLDGHEAPVTQVLFTKDLVVSSSRSDAHVWRPSDWSHVARMRGAESLALHPKAAVLVPSKMGAVKLGIYRLDGTLVRDHVVAFFASRLVVRTDGISLGCCYDGNLHVWDTRKLNQ